MATPSKIAVAGATGRAGHHLVDLLEGAGHDVVAISRSHGVDVITGEGLEDAVVGVDTIVDVATGPSPEKNAATEFFVTAARNLQAAGERAGVRLPGSRRSPARESSAWSTWRVWWRPSEAARHASRRPATPTTRTAGSSPATACCRARTPSPPARPSRTGWIRSAEASGCGERPH
jgi:hypothetical protein